MVKNWKGEDFLEFT